MPLDAALAGLHRRRLWLQGLLLAGSGLLTPAGVTKPAVSAPADPAAWLLGVAALPGSTSAQLAAGCARHLARQLGAPVALAVLPPGTELLSWGRSGPSARRLLLVEAWQQGQAPAGHGAADWQTQCLDGAQPLALLTREPLVLAGNRLLPADMTAWRAAALADDAVWRYGADGTDPGAADLVAACLQQAGLGRLRPVLFRGPAQLLPALAGARMQLGVQFGADVLAGPACRQQRRSMPGQRWDAAHTAGDIRLLAVADARRSPWLPGLPTLAEALGGTGLQAARCRLLLAAPGLALAQRQQLAAAAATLPTGC
jgi:hypothetical protein